MSFQTMLRDLEAVVDALALTRFALPGISGGAAELRSRLGRSSAAPMADGTRHHQS
jgi:hypothetical protein